MTFLNISQPRVNIEVVKLVITLLILNSFFVVKFFQIVVQKIFHCTLDISQGLEYDQLYVDLSPCFNCCNVQILAKWLYLLSSVFIMV